MPIQSTSATKASLEHHFYMVEAYLIAARDAFAPTLGLIPTAQELGTTQSGLPKQPDVSRLATAPDIARHAARCQVGNVNLGYAYELGFKLLIRLDSPKETFKGKDGHDLSNLYNKLAASCQLNLTEQDLVLGTHYIDYKIQITPKGTKFPRAKHGRQQKSGSLGERLRTLQNVKFLLDSRYQYVEKLALPLHVFCPHWTWKTMEWTLTDMIRPALERRLAGKPRATAKSRSG